MKRFGVHKGMRLAVVTTTLMMCGVIIYLRIRTNPLDFSRLIFFIMGAYALMSIIHVYMFKAIWGGK
jgi:hypothetical protein